MLEELLRSAILKRLASNRSSQELFGEESNLGLAMLAKYAHALGIIGSLELEAIKKLAKVRNKIAHNWSADFSEIALQKIAREIQLVRLQGEQVMQDHQRCFARLDYLGIFLIEEFLNRFSKIPRTSYDGGVFTRGLVVDPATGTCTKTVGPDQ